MPAGSTKKGKHTRCSRSRKVVSHASVRDPVAAAEQLEHEVRVADALAANMRAGAPISAELERDCARLRVEARSVQRSENGGSAAGADMLDALASRRNAAQQLAHKLRTAQPSTADGTFRVVTGAGPSSGSRISHQDYASLLSSLYLSRDLDDPGFVLRACDGREKVLARTVAAAAQIRASQDDLQTLDALAQQCSALAEAGYLGAGRFKIPHEPLEPSSALLEMLKESRSIIDLWSWDVAGGRQRTEELLSQHLQREDAVWSAREKLAGDAGQDRPRFSQIAEELSVTASRLSQVDPRWGGSGSDAEIRRTFIEALGRVRSLPHQPASADVSRLVDGGLTWSRRQLMVEVAEVLDGDQGALADRGSGAPLVTLQAHLDQAEYADEMFRQQLGERARRFDAALESAVRIASAADLAASAGDRDPSGAELAQAFHSVQAAMNDVVGEGRHLQELLAGAPTVRDQVRAGAQETIRRVLTEHEQEVRSRLPDHGVEVVERAREVLERHRRNGTDPLVLLAAARDELADQLVAAPALAEYAVKGETNWKRPAFADPYEERDLTVAEYLGDLRYATGPGSPPPLQGWGHSGGPASAVLSPESFAHPREGYDYAPPELGDPRGLYASGLLGKLFSDPVGDAIAVLDASVGDGEARPFAKRAHRTLAHLARQAAQ
jgi:hypothetical protein